MTRKRLTLDTLRYITAMRYQKALRENTPINKVEIIIPYLCWLDLRMDRDIFASVDWAKSSAQPKHIMCDGIRCVIEQYPGELVAMFEE